MSGFPYQLDLRRGQAVSLADDIAEGALHVQDSDGEGTGGFDGASAFGPQRINAGVHPQPVE